MLIAFSGKFGSGKDTAGERLASMVDVPTRRVSFAQPLKESAAALLDIPADAWETYKNDSDVKILIQVGWEQAEVVTGYLDDGHPVADLVDVPNIVKEFTAREFLQRYGTESHRGIFGEDFWVDQALKDYDPIGLTYVTDCRFSNEAQAVQALGGYVVRVNGANEETGTHASETPLPTSLVTFEIDNVVRGDNFANLDRGLKSMASIIGISLKKEALV